MSIAIFIEYGNEVIQFPVNPEEINLVKEGNNETVEVVKLGEVSVSKDVKLATTEFESFLPLNNNYPFILTKNKFQAPKFYIDFIEKIRKEKKPVRFIVSDTNINMLALIDSFEYGYKAADEDVHYKISLTEYREIKIKTVQIVKEDPRPSSQNRPEPQNKQVVPGCNVICNGRLHRDSWGRGPGKTLSNYHGKVNFVKTDGRSHPYHITTSSGSWLGWVIPSAITVK